MTQWKMIEGKKNEMGATGRGQKGDGKDMEEKQRKMKNNRDTRDFSFVFFSSLFPLLDL